LRLRTLTPLSLVAVTLGMSLLAPFAHAQASGGATGSATMGANPGAASDDLSPAAKSYATSTPPAPDPRTPPPAKPGALTLQQVVDRAHLNNPTLLSAEQNLRSVRAQEIQAAVRVNPTVGVNASNVTITNDQANNPYAYAAYASRLFELGNKRGYRIDTARATTAMTAAQLQDTIRQTELAVRQAFTTMLIAKEALQLSQAQLKDFRHEVEIGHDRYTAGDLGKLDFERLDLQLGSFESDEQNAEIAMEQASDTLQTLMGIATPSADFDVIGAIVPPPITQTREQLVATAQQQRPDLLAAQAAVRQSSAQYNLAKANGTTDPTLEMEYDRTGTQNSLGFQASVPLRIFDRNQGNKETARLQINAAQLTETATRNQVGSDVNQAWSAYIHAKVLSSRFGDHYLDESADVLSIARYAFDHGGLALIDYLDALRDARSSTSNALNAYSQTWMAIHQLSAATATDLAP
jgi:cobalt-zinc-cadmium efflux system outer membrane protein